MLQVYYGWSASRGSGQKERFGSSLVFTKELNAAENCNEA